MTRPFDEEREFAGMPYGERLSIVAGHEDDEHRAVLLTEPYLDAAARLAIDQPGRFAEVIHRLRGWKDLSAFNRRVQDRKDKLESEGSPEEGRRPIIRLALDRLTENLDAGERALRIAGANVYQQNGRIVQLLRHNRIDDAEPCTEEAQEPVRRAAGALIVGNMSEPLLVERLLAAAEFRKFDARAKSEGGAKGAWVASPPPPGFARHILARGEWHLHVLRNTTEAPTLRPDGSLLQRPGYDMRSQLFYEPNGVKFPSIPKSPTRDEALAALAKLCDPIKDFPFVPDEDEEDKTDESSAEPHKTKPSAARSVALSMMLTGLVRRSIRTAPAHGVDAPVAGTGKTKLGQIAAVLATGHDPTTVSQGATEEEFGKRLFSTLLAGDAVIIIDNIEHEIASEDFNSMLTSEQHQSRLLGVSQMATVNTNALFILNGNRMTFKGDITDRVVLCNLDARMEDPKLRQFDREPVAHTLAHRADLVTAGLTILRAHVVAGYPGAEGLSPSRFPDWDRMVRGALVWLGEPDPQVTRERAVAIDPVRDIHATLLRKWEEAIGLNVPLTAQQAIDRASVEEFEVDRYRWPPTTPWPEEAAAELREAMVAAIEGKGLNSLRLGKYLNQHDGQIYDGVALVATPFRNKPTIFRLLFHRREREDEQSGKSATR